MGRLTGRVVFITGASSGIGEACAHAFAKEGAKLLLAARRVDRIEELAPQLEADGAQSVECMRLDVRNADAVEDTIADLGRGWGAIEVLVNNAGLSRGLAPLHQGDRDDWNEMIDTNVKGLLWVSRAVVPGMVERGSGTVLHIGSIAGHETYPKGNVYCATKHAVRAIGEAMRLDLNGTGVRVGSIDPGMVDTEFSEVRFRGDLDRARAVYQGMEPLTAEDVAEIVVFAATRPPHVSIAELLVLPTDQASATLIHRRNE